jgi:hypothetical protein
MTDHTTGSLKCPLVADAVLYVWANQALRRRIVARRPPAHEFRRNNLPALCSGPRQFTHPVRLDRQRPDIDDLLNPHAHVRRSPTERTIHDRYLAWCRRLGRADVFNRRLARRYIKQFARVVLEVKQKQLDLKRNFSVTDLRDVYDGSAKVSPSVQAAAKELHQRLNDGTVDSAIDTLRAMRGAAPVIDAKRLVNPQVN